MPRPTRRGSPSQGSLVQCILERLGRREGQLLRSRNRHLLTGRRIATLALRRSFHLKFAEARDRSFCAGLNLGQAVVAAILSAISFKGSRGAATYVRPCSVESPLRCRACLCQQKGSGFKLLLRRHHRADWVHASSKCSCAILLTAPYVALFYQSY